jgi:hypothetical protein
MEFQRGFFLVCKKWRSSEKKTAKHKYGNCVGVLQE